jgi:hypothetical protein
MDNGSIYISDKLWQNPKYAIREGKLQYLGMLGWYPDDDHKRLYKILDDQFQISKMCPGEYVEINFDYNDEQNSRRRGDKNA